MLFNKQNLLNLNQNLATTSTSVSVRVKALPSRGDFDTYLSSADTEGGNSSFDRAADAFVNLPVTESADNRLLRYRESMKIGWEIYDSKTEETEKTATFKGLLKYHPTEDIFSYVGNRTFNIQRATLILTTKNKKPVTGTFQVEYMKNDPVISESATWESPSPETDARWFSPTVAPGSSAALTTYFSPGVFFPVKEDTTEPYDFSQPQYLTAPCVLPPPTNPNHPAYNHCPAGFNGFLKPGCDPCAAGIPGWRGCVHGGWKGKTPLRPPPIQVYDRDGRLIEEPKPFAVNPVTGCEYYRWEGNIWERCPGRNPVWRVGGEKRVNVYPADPPQGEIIYPPAPPGNMETNQPSVSIANFLMAPGDGKVITWDDYVPCFGIPLCSSQLELDNSDGTSGSQGNNPSPGGRGPCDQHSHKPGFRCTVPYDDEGCARCSIPTPSTHARPKGVRFTPEEEWRDKEVGPRTTWSFCSGGSTPCIPIGNDDCVLLAECKPKIIMNPDDWEIGDTKSSGTPPFACTVSRTEDGFTICCDLPPGPDRPEGENLCAVYAWRPRDIRDTDSIVTAENGDSILTDSDDCKCRPEGGCVGDPDPYGNPDDDAGNGGDGPIGEIPQPEILNEDTSGSSPGTILTNASGYYGSLISTTTVKNSSSVQFDITKLVGQWANDPTKPLSFTVRYYEDDGTPKIFEFNTMEAPVLPVGDGVYTTCRFLTGGDTTDIKTAGVRSILEQTDNGVKITVVENDPASQTAMNSFASIVGTGETFAFVDPDTNNSINIGAATCTMLSRLNAHSIIVAGISLPSGVEAHETTVDLSATGMTIPDQVYILDINSPTKKALNAFTALSAGDAISVNYSSASTANNSKEFTVKSVSDETLFHNRLRVYLNEAVVSEDRRNKPTEIQEAGIRPSLSIDLLID